MKHVYFSFLILLILEASCTEKKAEANFKQNFQIEITDSLQIDYLGDLWIQDYDSISQEFVAVTKNDQELLFIDSKGEITSNLKIPFEGPNSMQGIFLLSYRNEMLQILSSVSGFHLITKDGDFKRSILLPYQYIIHNNSIDPAFSSLGEKIAYFKPASLGEGGIRDVTDFVKYLYSAPFLEVLDTVSMERHDTMDFPKTSLYSDGNFYFFPFPKIQKLGSKWYLHFFYELKYYVYKEMGDEIVLEKTVDLEVKEAVLPRAENFEVAMEYTTSDQRPASILQLYRDRGKTIVFYKKGIQEELVKNSLSDPSVELVDKTFVAVFDKDNNLIQNGIEVPEGLIFSRAITEKGEILAKKNQDFFGTEEDQVVFYKLKVVEE
jgi:hypothetical protein